MKAGKRGKRGQAVGPKQGDGSDFEGTGGDETMQSNWVKCHLGHRRSVGSTGFGGDAGDVGIQVDG